MQNKSINSLLENCSLIEIEEKIAQFYNCKVLFSNRELIIGVIQEDIEKSGFLLNDIELFIEKYKNTIIDFGIVLLKDDKPKEGIYFGFSTLYAIYLQLLIIDDKKRLLNFLKSLRIPKPKLFFEQLLKIKTSIEIFQ